MKKCFIIGSLLFSFMAHSQSLIDSLSNPRFTLNDSIGAHLVTLALQNPNLKVIDKQIDAGKYEWKATKGAWLNNLSANFNLNERSLKNNTNTVTGDIFYPRYNFNLNLPLGNFFTRPAQTKKAKAQVEELTLKKEVATAELRQTVLTSYQDYLMYKYLLALQETTVQDETIVMKQLEDKFKNNTATIETFTAASKRLTEALAQRITLMRNVNSSKYQLENLIGMTLEEAMIAITKK